MAKQRIYYQSHCVFPHLRMPGNWLIVQERSGSKLKLNCVLDEQIQLKSADRSGDNYDEEAMIIRCAVCAQINMQQEGAPLQVQIFQHIEQLPYHLGPQVHLGILPQLGTQRQPIHEFGDHKCRLCVLPGTHELRQCRMAQALERHNSRLVTLPVLRGPLQRQPLFDFDAAAAIGGPRSIGGAVVAVKEIAFDDVTPFEDTVTRQPLCMQHMC